MFYNHRRFKNRLLQAMYRPRMGNGSRLFKDDVMAFFDEIDNKIEEKIAPFYDEFL